MIFLVLFTLVPLALGAAAQYAALRFTMRETGRWWKQLRLLRLVPLLVSLLLVAGIAAGRWQIWQSDEVSPLTPIICFPGVPGVFLLLGLVLGWRAFRRRWDPRLISGTED